LQNLGNTKYSLLTSPCRPIAERYSLWVLGTHALLAFDFFTPSQRSGAWLKMRVNQGQEFVIGGYTPGPKNFDALIFGYYER